MPPLPFDLYDHACAVATMDDGRSGIMVAGGASYQQNNQFLLNVEFLDWGTKQWEELADLYSPKFEFFL